MRLRAEAMKEWRTLLLVCIDLLAILALFPRVTRSTTELAVTEINSSQIVEGVLRSSYGNVTLISSSFGQGLWVHSFSFSLPGEQDVETLESELKFKLSGMFPRGIPPKVSRPNASVAYANITVTDRDCIVALVENSLPPGGKIIWLQAFSNSVNMTINKRLDRKALESVLGAAARIVHFNNNRRTIKTNLKLGIDFLGGFYYNVKPVGVTFRVRIEGANATQLLLERWLNKSVVLKEKGERGLLTYQFPTRGEIQILTEVIVNDFFSSYPSLTKISFSFGNETSELVINASNYDALQAVLNTTLAERYDIVGGEESSGIFQVEGKGSEATRTQIEEAMGRYVQVLSFQSKVSPETMAEMEKMIESRANFFGVSDLRIKRAGGEYIIVESPERIAAGSSLLEPLDFEARLWVSGDRTMRAFTSEDVARVDHYYYVATAGGWAVPITLKRKAAEALRQLALTYSAIDPDDEVRRKHPLGMFFNGIEVYNASFSKELAQSMREEPVVSFLAITGGPRENNEARRRAEELYINLEASFPTKLRTAGEGQIPAMLGRDFGRQVLSAATAAVIGVFLLVYARYRRLKLVLAIVAISLSEVLIILGFSVLIGWYLDLSSVAAIVAVIGTGVDHQIVITDEALYQGEGKKRLVISTRISRAFFIIFAAAATTIIAMSPLAYVGLGRLRGFAIVTIVGVLSGVLITRPAYGRIVRYVIGG